MLSIILFIQRMLTSASPHPAETRAAVSMASTGTPVSACPASEEPTARVSCDVTESAFADVTVTSHACLFQSTLMSVSRRRVRMEHNATTSSTSTSVSACRASVACTAKVRNDVILGQTVYYMNMDVAYISTFLSRLQ